MSERLPEKAKLAASGRAEEVIILSKKGCHLCEAVGAEVHSMITIETGLRVVNMDEDRALDDTYWLKVPVFRIHGKDALET